jgi:hypothetical protein
VESINERKLIVISFSVLVLFFGSALATEYVNRNNYEKMLDHARATVLADLEMNGVEVLYESPDWDNLWRMSIMNTDSYNVFKQRCLWENSSSAYYDEDRGGFYVVVPKYNQIWEYGIKISKNRQPPNPFYTYTWENSIE